MFWLLVSTALAQPECVAPAPFPDGRPILSGPVETLDSADGRFRVHFTRDGVDAPSGDEGTSGVPRMVDQILDGLQMGATRFLELGYRHAWPDEGEGGSAAIDVYIDELDSNGFAHIVNEVDGQSSCYIRLNPNLATLGDNVVESVAIHELHHCVQYAYTTETDTFLYESTATYEQYGALTSDALQVALDLLYIVRLTQTQRPLDDARDRFEYAGMLFMKFWVEYAGLDDTRLPALWEQLAQTPEWEDALIEAADAAWDMDLAWVFLDFARYNAFACARDDGQHYLQDNRPCTADTEVPFTLLTSPTESADVVLEESPYSAAYVRWADVTAGMTSSLRCTAPSSTEARLLVWLGHLDADGALLAWDAVDVDEGIPAALTDVHSEGGSSLAVLASVGDGPVTTTCTLTEHEPLDRDKQGCSCASVRSVWVGWWMALLLVWRRRSVGMQ